MAADHQHDRAHRPEPQDKGQGEQQAVEASAWRGQDEDDRHDRKRADRDSGG
jgi:hypothetical protein